MFACLADAYFPFEWKRQRVFVVLKAPDKDRSDSASYQGIWSMSGCLVSSIKVSLAQYVLSIIIDFKGALHRIE